MTLIDLKAWLEKQDIECPPHLVPKRIIDRRGVETHRCVTPIYSDDEVYSEDVSQFWGAGSKKLFTAEFEAPYVAEAKHNEQDVRKDVFSMTMEMLENSPLDEEDKENAFGSVRRDFPIDETLDAVHMQKIYPSREINSPFPDMVPKSTKYLRNRDESLNKRLFEIAKNFGIHDLLADVELREVFKSWVGSSRGEGAEKLNETISEIKMGLLWEYAGEEGETLEEKIKELIQLEQNMWSELIDGDDGDGTMRVYRGVNVA